MHAIRKQDTTELADVDEALVVHRDKSAVLEQTSTQGECTLVRKLFFEVGFLD